MYNQLSKCILNCKLNKKNFNYCIMNIWYTEIY